MLVDNAGYGHEGIVEESSLDDLRRQFDVNAFGAIAVTRAFLPHFRQRRQGRIVNITSMGGHIALPYSSSGNSGRTPMPMSRATSRCSKTERPTMQSPSGGGNFPDAVKARSTTRF